MELTEAQTRELTSLASWFPFRIIYGAINRETGEWQCGAVTNMRVPNKLARTGWHVVRVTRG